MEFSSILTYLENLFKENNLQINALKTKIIYFSYFEKEDYVPLTERLRFYVLNILQCFWMLGLKVDWTGGPILIALLKKLEAKSWNKNC